MAPRRSSRSRSRFANELRLQEGRTQVRPSFARTRSVVIAGLKELDAIVRHEVNQPMLLRKSPGPRSGSQILQRLRLPDSREWVAKDGFNKVERTKRDFPFVSNPEAKVFPKFGMEHRYTHRRPNLRRAR